jgi:hypothetical protein
MHVNLGEIHYDARRGTFEARVDICRDGRTFRYPCKIDGPPDMDSNRVALGLTRQAMRMSDSGKRVISYPDPRC